MADSGALEIERVVASDPRGPLLGLWEMQELRMGLRALLCCEHKRVPVCHRVYMGSPAKTHRVMPSSGFISRITRKASKLDKNIPQTQSYSWSLHFRVRANMARAFFTMKSRSSP